MSHKTCFAACAIASLTVFTLFGCSGVDPYRSVEARPVVADTGSLIGDVFVIIAILAALEVTAVSLMAKFVKGKSGTADSGFADQVHESPRKSPKN
jgi:hypothetical protein